MPLAARDPVLLGVTSNILSADPQRRKNSAANPPPNWQLVDLNLSRMAGVSWAVALPPSKVPPGREIASRGVAVFHREIVRQSEMAVHSIAVDCAVVILPGSPPFEQRRSLARSASTSSLGFRCRHRPTSRAAGPQAE